MFGAAETDFQPRLAGLVREQRAQIGRRRFARIEREAGQQRLEQRGLPSLERMPFAAAEKGARRMTLDIVGILHRHARV